jgi:CheY-like chemotaxis protein
MNETGCNHTVLCVDDERNIISSLKRLLRKEDYNLLTASSATEGLEILKQHDVHLVISDHRMPEMSGTEFLAVVREQYPDIVRVVLSGYTDVDAITASINKGHVYKFILKPWNDESLKLEIRQALEQYDLVQANRNLDKKVVEQNQELKLINENLESMVQVRTEELKMQNQALELSRSLLQHLPLPIIGVGADGMIAVMNQEAQALFSNDGPPTLGGDLADSFSVEVRDQVVRVMETGTAITISDESSNIEVIPLSGRFQGKGAVMMWKERSPTSGLS